MSPTWTRRVTRLAHSRGVTELARLTDVSARYRTFALRRALTRVPGESPYKVTMLVVGRQKNRDYLTALARQFGVTDLRIWSLDGPIDGLESSTMGTGTGSKFDLLNKLFESSPVPDDHWVVVADDDVVLSRGSGRELIAVGAKAGFDLFQPAHSLVSLYTYDFLVGLPGVRAETVSFVEIGPLFVVPPHARAQFLPFPPDAGMGYGLELRWWNQHRAGARFGVVSQCRMVHCSPIGALYPVAPEKQKLQGLLAENGLSRISEAQVRYERWWRWSPEPPWRVPPQA